MTKVDISNLLERVDDHNPPPFVGDRCVPVYNVRVSGRTLEFSLPNPSYSAEADFRNGTLELYVGVTGSSMRQVLHPISLPIPKGTKRVVYKGNQLSNTELDYVGNVTKAEEGGYVVSFPDLPGAVTQGETLSEAKEAGIDAAEGYLKSIITHDGRSAIPKSTYSPKKLGPRKHVLVTFNLGDLL